MSWMTALSTGLSLASGVKSLFGGDKSKGMGEQLATQLKWQKEAANDLPIHQVRGWEKAGIHPLYAAGSPAFSSSPISLGGGFSTADSSDMGQGLSRAAMAVGDADQRRMELKAAELQLERGGLENDLLRSEIARNVQQLGPPMPSVDTVKVPHEIFANRDGFMPGKNPAHQDLHWNDKDSVRAMSEALNNAGLDDGPAQWYYQLTRTVPDMLYADIKKLARRAISTKRGGSGKGFLGSR